jgi:hypothetical protein
LHQRRGFLGIMRAVDDHRGFFCSNSKRPEIGWI